MSVHSLRRVSDSHRSLSGLWFALLFAVMVFIAQQSAFTQESPHQEPIRKVKKSVQPEYPELARRLNLRGTVRLQLLVTAEGKVKEAKVLGGNPVLAQAAVEAAQKWIFEPGALASTVVLKFEFNP